MHRPDTIIEIHRERVQDQTVDIFSGDKYTISGTANGFKTDTNEPASAAFKISATC